MKEDHALGGGSFSARRGSVSARAEHTTEVVQNADINSRTAVRSCVPENGSRTAANGCMQCGKALTYNEVGAYKKFINRGSTRFLCKACLAAKLDVAEADIDRKIEQFKQQGCSLFV